MRSVPRGDLVPPAHDGAAELADLGWARLVLEITTQPADEAEREVGVVMVVDAAHDFLRVPRHADLASWVAGLQQADELGATPLVEAFVGLGQQAPRPVERVRLVAAVTERLVLHPATHLVEALVRELAHMERSATWVASGSIVSNTSR